MFRVAVRACTPPGLSVYEFRRLLEHPEMLRPRHRARRILLVGAALGLTAAAFWVVRSTSVAPKTNVADSQTAAPATAAPSRFPERVDRYAGRSKDERKLDGAIRIRLEGVKMNLQTAERNRRAFLDRDLDLPEQQTRVDELRAELERLEKTSSCVWNPRLFADDERRWQCPFGLCLHPQGFLRRGVRASGPSQERTGESGAFGMWHHPRGSSRISS